MAKKSTSEPKPAQAKASAAPAAAPEPAAPTSDASAPAEQKAADQPPAEQPPAEKAKPAAKSKDLVVKVSTTAERGRWRIGRQFGREITEIPLSEITDDQLNALRADPVLSVTVEPANPASAA